MIIENSYCQTQNVIDADVWDNFDTDIIQSFGFKISTDQFSSSVALIKFELLYDEYLYECYIIPEEQSTSTNDIEYSCLGINSIIGTGCRTDINKLYIKNTDTRSEIDAVKFDYVFVIENDGTKVQITTGTTCLDVDDCSSSDVLIDLDGNTPVRDFSNKLDPQCDTLGIFYFN